MTQLRRVTAETVPPRRTRGLDDETAKTAQDIVATVRRDGIEAVRHYAETFGDVARGAQLTVSADALKGAFLSLAPEERALLERVAARIRRFAEAQRASVNDLDVAIDGGRAGHRWTPMRRAGCYAPGGRFPLPSSVLMTAITARVAGVESVVVASPKPAPVTLAAAHVAGAEQVLAFGGAHAIAAMAYGARPIGAVDVIVGPGNRFVTAAKKWVAGDVAIDMLAGPSELVVLADDSADCKLIAADLLGQAEHDDDAIPILVTPSAELAAEVDVELARQLADLPTAETARNALKNGYAVISKDLNEAVEVCDRLAPEHLQLMCAGAAEIGERLRNYGGLFIGSSSAEVFGDYGAGPNHVLPTGGTARFSSGLSVLDFMRPRTWLEVGADAKELRDDSAALARLEGLEAHARAAEARNRRA